MRPSLSVFFRCLMARKTKLSIQQLFLGRSAWRGTIAARRHLYKTRIELHAETQPELLQFVFDLVERFLAEIAILQHLGLGFLGKLTDGCNIRVVQAIRRADTELNFIHAHVEQLLELQILLAYPSRGLVEFDHFLVEFHEHIQMMPQNRRGLKQRIIGGQSTIGPDLQNELVVIGTLTDTRVFDRVLDARDW